MAEGSNQPSPGTQDPRTCAAYQEWISAYLDGELDAETRRRLEAHVLQCPACRREYDTMKRLILGTAAAFAVEEPPVEAWDTFLDGVYNRMERKTGWAIFVLGALALTGYAVFLFFTEPWGTMVTKILLAIPVIGLAMVFLSVLRQRLHAAKTDRYSKEVYR